MSAAANLPAPSSIRYGPLGPRLSDADFRRFSGFIYDTVGISLGDVKKTLVETRLRKRIEDLGLPSFRAYYELLTGPDGEAELAPLLDRITTNKTDFFREPNHFDYLVQRALPELAARHMSGLRQPLAVWSAGCSSGEEPYTMAMVLSEYAAAQAQGRYRFAITATDISTRVLDKAVTAVYPLELIAPVPIHLRHKYLLRSRNPQQKTVRICPALRALIDFRRLNLMDTDYGFGEPFDVIFCRNVMIYFDKPTQERLVNRYAANLRPGGYLFIGHSETLNGLDTQLAPVAPSTYRSPL
jgi:chemotaxis protein methyltransferase CheR